MHFSPAEPAPAVCCPDAYCCPGSGETECSRHRRLGVCCARPGRHLPVDKAAWNLLQEIEEQRLLDALHRRIQELKVVGGPACMLGAVLDEVLGVVPSSTLGGTLDVAGVPVGCAAG